jgi:hypothetical protein
MDTGCGKLLGMMGCLAGDGGFGVGVLQIIQLQGESGAPDAIPWPISPLVVLTLFGSVTQSLRTAASVLLLLLITRGGLVPTVQPR